MNLHNWKLWIRHCLGLSRYAIDQRTNAKCFVFHQVELEVVLGGEHSCSQMEFVFIREGEDLCTSIRKCNGKETSTSVEQTSCLVRSLFIGGVLILQNCVACQNSFWDMCSVVFHAFTFKLPIQT